MALLQKSVYQMGPLLRLQWHGVGESEVAVKQRGTLWLERAVLERLRACLLPAAPPAEKAHVHQSSCWLWTGPVDGDGHGVVYNQDRSWLVHRLLYTIQWGPLGQRSLLYSTCGVPRCCNPMHHTVVERGPIDRGPAVGFTVPRCKYGHALTPENLYEFGGKRYCRDCRAQAQARYRGRQSRRPPPSSPSPRRG